MRKLSLTLLTCLLFLSPNVVLSEDWKDLVKRDGIHYKKFSQIPFSGEIFGGITIKRREHSRMVREKVLGLSTGVMVS
jgi:hypothetical protein